MRRAIQRHSFIAAIALLVGLQTFVEEATAGYGEHPTHPTLSDEASEHLHFLNELGNRRRSSTLFRNEQSIVHGAQLSYVNVGSGNLTFARRDLVVVGRIPLVFARVYDSRSKSTGDFGPGWRIAGAETIDIKGNKLRLFDETGSGVAFRTSGSGDFVPATQESSPVIRISRSSSGELSAELQGGWTRTFRYDGGVYRLVTVTDRFGNSISLRYTDGRLSEITSGKGRYIRVLRGKTGLVDGIEDEQGRGVRYRYDELGRLAGVFDLGGNEWVYGYDHKHLLVSLVNPEGYEELAAQHDGSGRVRHVFANGMRRDFEYTGRTTEVRDSVTGTARFLQDKQGITIRVESFAGSSTAVELNEANRAAKLIQGDSVSVQFTYGNELLQSSRWWSSGSYRHIDYTYGPNGRLENIRGALNPADVPAMDSIVLEYDSRGALSGWTSTAASRKYSFSQQGDVERFIHGDASYSFEANSDGQITLSRAEPGEELRFSYRSNGKLESTRYWDDTSVAYEWDPLGTRSFADWGSHGNVTYTYNRVGSAREILTESMDQRPGGHVIALDEQQRVNSVTYANGGFFDVTYDAAGNPRLSTSSANDSSQYEYDALNRLLRITTNGVQVLNYEYGQTEVDLRAQTDHKTMRTVLPKDRASVVFGNLFEIVYTRAQGTPLDTVIFDEDIAAFRPVGALGVILEDAAVFDALNRMRLINAERSGFEGKDRFEQPSNVLFIPAEYVTMNCCVPCPPSHPWLCGTCFWPEGADAPICYCAPLPTTTTLSLSISQSSVWPSGTPGPNTLVVTAQISPPISGAIAFQAGAISGSGGHVSHTGGRPAGSFSPATLTTGSNGQGQSTWTAPSFGGQVSIVATYNTLSVSQTVNAVVPGLQQLASGTNYNIVGSTSTHPTNNFVTSAAATNLIGIANDYQAAFYTSAPPSGERLRYNDMSLVWGGKFDLAANWCTSCSHAEHRVGSNCDVGSSNVPSNRRATLTAIFAARGSPNFVDETATLNHWHLRF